MYIRIIALQKIPSIFFYDQCYIYVPLSGETQILLKAVISNFLGEELFIGEQLNIWSTHKTFAKPVMSKIFQTSQYYKNENFLTDQF